MDILLSPLLQLKEYNKILKALDKVETPLKISGPADSQKAHLCFSICRHLDVKGIFLTHNDLAARRLYEDLSFFEKEGVLLLPPREIMLYDVEARSNEQNHARLQTLYRLINNDYKILVASIESFSQKLPPLELFKSLIIDISEGQDLNFEETVSKLVDSGYERVECVEGKGQFAKRGGILDIFCVNLEQPVRIELFGDEVDTIREFDVNTQRSLDRKPRVSIIPAKEVIITKADMGTFLLKLKKVLSPQIQRLIKAKEHGLAHQLEQKVDADMERYDSSHSRVGLDRYAGLIDENRFLPCDFAEGQPVIFIDDSERVNERLENYSLEYFETVRALVEKGMMLPDIGNPFVDNSQLEITLNKYRRVEINTFEAKPHFSILSKGVPSFQGHIELLIESLKQWKLQNYKILMLSGTKSRGERLLESLQNNGIEAVYKDDRNMQIAEGQIVITHGTLNRGFEYPEANMVIVGDKEAFGQDRKLRKSKSKKEGVKIKAFAELEVGDFVVHQAHGIGQYVGIEKLVVEGIKKDYLKIKYGEGGFLYIPADQLELIQKYIGSDGKTPKMNKLGGSEWTKTKTRVKESLRQMAEELVKIYAERQALKGYKYSDDTVWQQQFEELFPYQETDDQLKSIEDIKEDMQSGKIMDRLLCGDVGYGKTEVAIRAIFKTVMEGKQVAYLVPTTVLAQQQYINFVERMKDFPVKVDVLSRFVKRTQQAKIVKDLKIGQVDVLVGTHRLLQKDIKFKDLGLLVVDEEQRFGVAHKEKIKNIKSDVNVLTLSATPIPRTLHMSLTGIRDISVLEEPPEERYPVQTYVMEYNPEMIRDAISREIARHGQVFYLYNKVRSIDIKAFELQNLVPEARICVAHGQMNEGQLEEIMQEFLEKKYDVLVCTTIIESGLDMPNVNTIVVEEADKMGLAQLYQLRGRVGRSNRLAYAYITYKKDKSLTEISEKRLQAIREFTEFGSGFKIAMRDMEIRGAGNLLGGEQHGHMETVGYDMFCRLLDESVREARGESPREEKMEISIDLSVSAYIDENYISSVDQKIEMYKKIAACESEEDVLDIEDEMLDRYGDMPLAVRNLIEISRIKNIARELKITSIEQKQQGIILTFSKDRKLNIENLGKLMEKYKRKLMFSAAVPPSLTIRNDADFSKDLLNNIKIILQDSKSFAV